MFFSLCLWATTVINSMTQIPGQTGWFKTERPALPIVSCAKDVVLEESAQLSAAQVACVYANTLADYRYSGHKELRADDTVSFVVKQVHEYMATNAEDGVIVHNTHKGTGISYITFLVGNWSSLQGQLDQILLQYHQKYQSAFPTASWSFTPVTTTSALSASAARSSTAAPFSLPTQGVPVSFAELGGVPFDQIRSGWDKFDQEFKRQIIREAIRKWPYVWENEQKNKPFFKGLLHQFVTSLPKHHDEESGCYEDRQISQREFFENCAPDLRVGSLDQLFIALPMFLMSYWNLLQPPAQQEQANDESGVMQEEQRDLRAKVVAAILTLGQRDDLGRLKDLYIEPLLQGAYGKISTVSLGALFDAYREFTEEVVERRYRNLLGINRGHLSALQKSFMDLLARCSNRMDQSTHEHQDLWNRAARVAGEQANLQFLTQYDSKFEQDAFADGVPLSLAPDVWQRLPERKRQRLFIDAASSDDNFEFVQRYRDDKSIDEETKRWAYEMASRKEQRFSRFSGYDHVSASSSHWVAAAASGDGKERAPQIAALLKQWAPSSSNNDDGGEF